MRFVTLCFALVFVEAIWAIECTGADQNTDTHPIQPYVQTNPLISGFLVLGVWRSSFRFGFLFPLFTYLLPFMVFSAYSNFVVSMLYLK